MKRYCIIYADPPWALQSMSGTSWKKGGEPLTKKYPLMSTNDIKELPVRDIASDSSVIFLWVTLSKLEDGLRVLEEWGFNYHAILTWDKGGGFCLHGFYRKTEHLLVGYKGRFLLNNKRGKYMPTLIQSKRTGHSRKPAIFRDLIVELVGDVSRIELFARERVPGWDAWGNEVESDVDLSVPKEHHADEK